jgi:chorismate synthase
VRVAAGAIARKWLRERYGIDIRGWMSQLGPIRIPFKTVRRRSTTIRSSRRMPIVPKLEAYMDALRKSGRFGAARARSRGGVAACRWAGASRCTTGSTPTSPTP